jgi:pyruvate/2-oxoglutarate dehydrogenase complex dihydrolipoamide dehydrogenase (E3) component
MDPHFDALVIGAGQSGPTLAVRLAQSGRKTAIIERDQLGGTCVNSGCVPSKTLIASARVAHLARRAADFGIVIDAPVSVDMHKIKERKDRLINASRSLLDEWLTHTPNLRLIRGEARFVKPDTLAVNDELLQAKEIFINVGAHAFVPPFPGLDAIDYLTSSSLLDLDFLPPHLLIIGGSYIGLEMAQMMRRFGSRVTLLESRSHILTHEDAAISDAVQALLENEGVHVYTSAQIVNVARRDTDVTIIYRKGSTLHQLDGSHLLLASGRQPNTAALGLDKVGVKTDARGYIQVDDQLRTAVPGIWALGEVNGRGNFTHTSFNDYEIVAANLLDHGQRTVHDRINAYAVYIDPPLAHIGLHKEEARASGRDILYATLPMCKVSRARERDETTGFMSLLVDAHTQKILGATLLGIEADEVIHALLDLMYAAAPVSVLRQAMHIHPTVSEVLPSLVSKLEPLV